MLTVLLQDGQDGVPKLSNRFVECEEAHADGQRGECHLCEAEGIACSLELFVQALEAWRAFAEIRSTLDES